MPNVMVALLTPTTRCRVVTLARRAKPEEICWGAARNLLTDLSCYSISVQVLRYPILAALLHGTRIVGVRQTLRRWAEGATYRPIRPGGHHVGHWPTF